MFCIPIPTSASTPFILDKSRMRKRARTDLCRGAASDGRPYRDSNRALLPLGITSELPSTDHNPLRGHRVQLRVADFSV